MEGVRYLEVPETASMAVQGTFMWTWVGRGTG